MPRKPARPCKHPGCPALVTGGPSYCPRHTPVHTRRPHDSGRPSATERGYTWKWRQFSKNFLRRHPYCVGCGARATITDHKVPFQVMCELYGGNTWRDEDYQPLCHACNTRKGVREDRELAEGGGGINPCGDSVHNRVVQQHIRDVSSSIGGMRHA